MKEAVTGLCHRPRMLNSKRNRLSPLEDFRIADVEAGNDPRDYIGRHGWTLWQASSPDLIDVFAGLFC